MFFDFAGKSSLGDTFGPGVKKAEEVVYIKTSSSCVNHSSSTVDPFGTTGDDGCQYLVQAKVCIGKKPLFILHEMVGNIMNFEGGEEVKTLCNLYVLAG